MSDASGGTFDDTFAVAVRLLSGETLSCGNFFVRGTAIVRKGVLGPERKEFSDVYEAAHAFVLIAQAHARE
jgi:hypothetical protein